MFPPIDHQSPFFSSASHLPAAALKRRPAARDGMRIVSPGLRRMLVGLLQTTIARINRSAHAEAQQYVTAQLARLPAHLRQDLGMDGTSDQFQ